jgi:OHCU decarboxylase
LNALPAAEAEKALLACCGSARWARAMAAERPFADVESALSTADSIWQRLQPEDWLEAFRAHPRIGETRPAADTSESAEWSRREQAGVSGARESVRGALAAGNAAYERRFGYIFIVCATGRTADEMLAMLNERLRHDPAAELRAAAGEQSKITRLRLENLLAAPS